MKIPNLRVLPIFKPIFNTKRNLITINPHQGIKWPVNHKYNAAVVIRNNNHNKTPKINPNWRIYATIHAKLNPTM